MQIEHNTRSLKRNARPQIMPHKILLIGPDAPLRASRQHLLERAGYVVKTATDDNALERLDEGNFEMVVLGPSFPQKGSREIEDLVRKAYPRAFIVKIQEWSAHRGNAPDAFVETGMPSELLEAIRALFNPKHERIAAVIPPRGTEADG